MRKANRFLRFYFRRMREAAIGPDLSHRRNLIESMVTSDALREAIAAEAARLRLSATEAESRARKFAWEIASDFSYPVVRAGELVLARLWRRLYDGVVVHHGSELAKIAPGKGLVYLPNHRSHIDYLLLSYLVHAQGLAPPHTAAGANLNFPLVGPILRRGGAFFLRRSFKGEPLYAAVFREYLHAMLAKGFPIAYFIEGGRSRSGRTLAPKGGLLGMTVESYMREHPRPLLLVPVNFSYEKVLEGRTLVAELEGQPKEGESLGALVARGARAAARIRQRARQFRHAAVDRPVPRPGGARLARAVGRRAARHGAPAHGHARARDGAADQRRRRRQSDQSLRDGDRAEPAPGARRARPRAADRMARRRSRPGCRTRRTRCWSRRIRRRRSRRRSRSASPRASRTRWATSSRCRTRKSRRSTTCATTCCTRSRCRRWSRTCSSRCATSRHERVAEFVEGGLPFLRAELMLRHTPEEAVAESRRIADLFVELGLARADAGGPPARRRSLQHRARGARAPRPLAAASAAPQLPDDRAR